MSNKEKEKEFIKQYSEQKPHHIGVNVDFLEIKPLMK
jgi:hypothetical protein